MMDIVIPFLTHLVAAMAGACVGIIGAALCIAASRGDERQ